MKDRLSDNWQTPQWLFDELDQEFHFDIDLCATKENSKCDVYCTNYLNNEYPTPTEITFGAYKKNSVTCFMNPPYSNPKPFIEKAWEDSKHCKIVCLVKCDPSTKWWAIFWQYEPNIPRGYRGPKPGCAVRFFPKRIKFDPPKDLLYTKCVTCLGEGFILGYETNFEDAQELPCPDCNSRGHFKIKLSGPTFPCALVIMDRRHEISS